MKFFIIILALVASILALPQSIFTPICPANFLQPHGKLPAGRSVTPENIFPISYRRPREVFLPSKWAKITQHDFCTIFNFEIENVQAHNKNCHLIFNFPPRRRDRKLYTIVGSSNFTFKTYNVLNAWAMPGNTTWETQPLWSSKPAVNKRLRPGKSYIIQQEPCRIPFSKGRTVRSVLMCSADSTFEFLESSEICPLGLFMIFTDA